MANVMDMLGKQAKKTPAKKKKEELPVLRLEDTEKNRTAIDNFIKHKQEEKSACNKKKKEEEKLLAQVIKSREEYCLVNKFQKSVKIQVGDDVAAKGDDPGRKSEMITAAFQSKWSAIKTEDQEDLEKLYGDKYGDCFKMVTTIKLQDKAMEDVERCAVEGKKGPLDKIMKAIGPEQFAEIFEVTQEIKPTESLAEKRVTDKEINKITNKAIDDELLKPQKPSFSV